MGLKKNIIVSDNYSPYLSCVAFWIPPTYSDKGFTRQREPETLFAKTMDIQCITERKSDQNVGLEHQQSVALIYHFP